MIQYRTSRCFDCPLYVTISTRRDSRRYFWRTSCTVEEEIKDEAVTLCIPMNSVDTFPKSQTRARCEKETSSRVYRASEEKEKDTEYLPNATRSCASETTSIIHVQTFSKTMSHSMRERLPTQSHTARHRASV